MELKTENFHEEIREGLILVDFYASWCGPCKMMSPIIENLAVEYAGKVKIGKLNVDTSPATAARYKVMSIPTMILFVGGNIKETIVGAVHEKDLVQKIEEGIKG